MFPDPFRQLQAVDVTDAEVNVKEVDATPYGKGFDELLNFLRHLRGETYAEVSFVKCRVVCHVLLERKQLDGVVFAYENSVKHDYPSFC